jgi:hypothetical protein
MEIIIEGHRYHITNDFKHPGEGIRGLYLKDFKPKKNNVRDVSDEFDRYHMTNEPWEILERARAEGSYQGVKYIGLVP